MYNKLVASPVVDNVVSPPTPVNPTTPARSPTTVSPATHEVFLEDERESSGGANDTVVYNDYTNQEHIPRISSPIHYLLPELSSLPDNCKANKNMNSSFKEISSPELYPGSWVTLHEETLLIDFFISRFNLTDNAATSLYSIVGILLPSKIVLPPAHAYVRQEKMQSDLNTWSVLQNESTTTLVLSFLYQLQEIFDYASFRSSDWNIDFNPNLA